MKTLNLITTRLGIYFVLAATLWGTAPALASTLTVTSTNDSGDGSLRKAIQDASPDDNINFAVTGTITLTNGQLLISNNLIIIGPGATNLAISGNDASRVFEIVSNISVTLSDLTIANGRNTNGGGIYNAGSLTLLQCALVTNVAFGSNTFYYADPAGDGCGGGVYNNGSVNIRNTLFQKNLARGGSVGSPTGQPGGSGFGGAICNAGILFVSASVFADNAARGSGGGSGAIATYFSGAIPGGAGGAARGGAIYSAAQNVYLTTSTFGGNTATGGNGGTGGNGLFGYCHTFPGNPRATRGADGGAGGGGYGGALCGSDGLIRIFSGTLSRNAASGGSGGAGGPGGTCFEGDGSAPSGDLGSPGYAIGGGAYGSTLNNCTLTGNSAAYGGGAYGSTLNNCIVYSNTAPQGTNYDYSSTLKYCCTTPQPSSGLGNITDAPLFVEQASANLRLQSGSPCINAGNNSYVANATDLDGNPRLSGGIVDIGAYEFQWPQLNIAPSGPNVLLRWPTNNVGYDYTGFTLQSTTNLVSPAVWSTNSAAPIIIGGQNVVTNPISGPQQFYRLRQ